VLKTFRVSEWQASEWQRQEMSKGVFRQILRPSKKEAIRKKSAEPRDEEGRARGSSRNREGENQGKRRVLGKGRQCFRRVHIYWPKGGESRLPCERDSSRSSNALADKGCLNLMSCPEETLFNGNLFLPRLTQLNLPADVLVHPRPGGVGPKSPAYSGE